MFLWLVVPHVMLVPYLRVSGTRIMGEVISFVILGGKSCACEKELKTKL